MNILKIKNKPRLIHFMIPIVVCLNFGWCLFYPVNVTVCIITDSIILISSFLLWMHNHHEQNSNDIFDQFFNNSIDLLCIADTSGHFLRLNPQWEETLGYTLEELEGKSFIEFVHPDDVESTIVATKQLANHQKIQNFINRYRHKDNSYRWIEWRSYPAGKLIYASARDITDQKKAENALKKSENKYRKLFEILDDGFALHELIYDKDGKAIDWIYVDVNKKYKEFWGAQNDIIGKSFFESFSFAEKMWVDLASDVVSTRHPRKTFDWLPNHDRYIETTEFWFDDNMFAAIFKDITKEHLASEKLKQSEEKFRNIVTNVDVINYAIDKNGIFTLSEGRSLDKLGLKSGEIVGSSVFEVYKDNPEITSAVNRCFAGESIEEIFKLNESFFDTRFTPTFDGKGQVTGLLGVSIDISDRKMAEKALVDSEKKYRLLFGNMTSGFALHQMIYDEQGNPTDFKYIEVNPAFEKMTGIDVSNLIGYTVKEVMPKTEDHWIQTFGIVAMTGEPISYMNYAQELGKYFDTYAFSPEKDTFAVIFNDATDRVNAQKELKASEEKFYMAFHTSPDAIAISRISDGQYLEVNKGLSSLLGYSIEEVIGMTSIGIKLWVNTEDRDRLVQGLTDKGEVKNQEIQFRKKDGEILIGLLSAVVINLQGEKCALSITRDITARKKIEESLKESEAKARLFVENVPLPVAMFDTNMRYIMASKRWSIDYKLGDQNLIGLSHYEVFPEIGETWKDDHRRVLSGEVYKKNADKFERADGTVQWLRYELYPWRKADDQIGGVVMFTEDITDRKLSEDALANTYETLKVILETIPVALFDLDTNGFVKSIWNPAAEQLTGWTKEEAIGNILPTVTPDKQSDFEYFLTSIKQGKIIKGADVERMKKNGESIYYSLFAAPLFNREGEISGNIAALVDINERKRIENEIRTLNDTLERKVIERTTQIEQANQDLEAFAYSVSHDLRAPIRHIDGFLKILYANIQDPNKEVTNFYKKIEAAATRMSTMIDNLLSFSRLGRKELTVSSVSLSALVKEIIEQSVPDTENRKIKWIIKNLPDIVGDKNLLKIAFENLISNAIKYTSKKQNATIEIGSTNISGNQVEIYIKDNGVGFNMAYTEKLFGVFQRLHPLEEFEGIGIGLANVKQIIQKHNGNIRAEGKTDEGAIFFITLPK